MTTGLQRLGALALVASFATQPLLAQSALPSTPRADAASQFERIAYPKPQAPQSSGNSPAPAGAEAQLDPSVAQAMGCVLAGSLGTGVAIGAGSENVVNIVAGGLVTPINQVALYTALAGVVFGAFCSVGQAITPLYLYATQPAAPAGGKDADELTCKQPTGSALETTRHQDVLIRASLAPAGKRDAEMDMATPETFRRRK